jgi:hypothetical protein
VATGEGLWVSEAKLLWAPYPQFALGGLGAFWRFRSCAQQTEGVKPLQPLRITAHH